MSQFTFSYVQVPTLPGSYPLSVTISTKSESLSEVLEVFQQFLSGCGFHFEEGAVIDVVPQDKVN